MAHILLVHDHQTIRSAITEYLEIFGHRVTSAPRARIALERAGPQIDVVVTDLATPGMGSFRFIQALRERHILAPAILMSGRFPPPEEAAAATCILYKPFSPDQLGEAIRGILGHVSADEETVAI